MTENENKYDYEFGVVNCPYCGHGNTVAEDESTYRDLYKSEHRCNLCEKVFVYNQVVCLALKSFKADCLNGAEHNLYRDNSFPAHYTKMKCNDCLYQRNLTEEEWGNWDKEKGYNIREKSMIACGIIYKGF